MQQAIRIKDDIFFQVIIQRIAVENIGRTDHHQPLFRICYINKSIGHVDGGFLVFRLVGPGRVRGNCGGGGHVAGVFGANIKPLAQRRNGCGGNAFRKALVICKGNVKKPQALLAAGGIKILAAGLYGQNFWLHEEFRNIPPRVLVKVLKLAAFVQMLFVPLRIDNLVQGRANHSLRLVALGHYHGGKAMLAISHPAIATNKIREIGALHEKLGHDGVVIAIL